jgi:molecular chaperone DnaJ
LKDDKKKAAYDQYGSAAQQPGFDPNAFAKSPFGAGFDFSAAFGQGRNRGQSDLFDSLFGFATSFGEQSRASRGDDIEAQVSLTFMEACLGATKSMNVSSIINCSTCSGSGLKPGARESPCMACGGTGTRTFVVDSGFQMASTCNSCQGAGVTVQRKDQCGTCKGAGRVRTKKTVDVSIPAGNTSIPAFFSLVLF